MMALSLFLTAGTIGRPTMLGIAKLGGFRL
jgi:hypothetical protein